MASRYLPARILPLLCAACLPAACGGFGEPGPGFALFLSVETPVRIPANRAHAKFQRGRPVRGVNRFDPWCDLEIDTVSPTPQVVEVGRFRVERVGQAFIRDYNTRMPALLGGLSSSLFVAGRIALNRHQQPARAFRELLPWAILIVLMMIAALSIFNLPMEMRGTRMIGI